MDTAFLDLLREVWPASQGIVLQGLRGAVDMQAHSALQKIDKEHADMWVLSYIAETGKDAIAAVFRIDQDLGVEDVDKSRQASPE
jgi:hypothetical protein